MDPNRGITRSHWLIGLLLGTIAGVIILGVGGRVAMRGIALYTGQAPGFSLGGSLTVIALGAVCGAGGGLLFVVVRRFFRNRLVRAGIFWTLIALVTLRGLRPVDPVRLTAFVPLTLMYGTMLQIVWCRIHGRRRAATTRSS